MLRSEPRPDPAELAEFADLVDDLRAVRPTPSVGTRARLELRADDAKERPLARRRLLPAGRRWRLGLAAAAVVAVAVPVAGVVMLDDRGTVVSSLTTFAADRTNGGAVTLRSLEQEVTPASGAGASGSSTATAGTSSVTPSSATLATTRGRLTIRDVTQTQRIEPDEVARAAARVSTVVADAGGHLDASTVRERGSNAGGTFSIVVPTGRLDETVASLSRIGRPVRLDRGTTDVTDRAASLQDRLDDVRADRSALRLQLARTVDPARRAARRRELSVLSSRVVRLAAQRQDLRSRTSTSTIALRITAHDPASSATRPEADDGRWGLDDALGDAGRVLQVVGGIVLVVGAAAIPLGLLLAALVLVGRWTAGRRRDRTIDGR